MICRRIFRIFYFRLNERKIRSQTYLEKQRNIEATRSARGFHCRQPPDVCQISPCLLPAGVNFRRFEETVTGLHPGSLAIPKKVRRNRKQGRRQIAIVCLEAEPSRTPVDARNIGNGVTAGRVLKTLCESCPRQAALGKQS